MRQLCEVSALSRHCYISIHQSSALTVWRQEAQNFRIYGGMLDPKQLLQRDACHHKNGQSCQWQ